MEQIINGLNDALDVINGILWHEFALYAILGVGILFTIWSFFCQYRALTHGVAITVGKYDRKDDPGAINHFQALSTALSATVGIGNIGGVALAVAIGGPGAVFWMWIIGFVGMALKTTEVTLAMLYRNVDDPENPHGGAMWVADKGFARFGEAWKPVGKFLAGLFCVTLLVATITGGNMFQAFNVAETTAANVPALQQATEAAAEWFPASSRPVVDYVFNAKVLVGIILAAMTALVIIGGIKRIGTVAGSLVPFMCGVYLLAALYVLMVHWQEIPELFGLIINSAFTPLESQGAFIGGSTAMAFKIGMERALFSNEAGQGSAPMAHAAARTDEPVREGLVAGLEPFIDTLIVCTMTALVILASGVWNRGPKAHFAEPPALVLNEEEEWTVESNSLPAAIDDEWQDEESIFILVKVYSKETPEGEPARLHGTVQVNDGQLGVEWKSISSTRPPEVAGTGIIENYLGAALTSHAFDQDLPGMGRWMVTIAIWLFAFSTVISWSYYGEQGMVYLFGSGSILIYRLLYCACIVIACTGFIRTDTELSNFSNLGTGLMLFANLPIMVIFGSQTMRAYHDYIHRWKAGETDRPIADATNQEDNA